MPQRITIAELTGLKPKEANFVIEYCKDYDARRAATMSGYQADYGYRLKEKDHIAAAIENIAAQRLDASHIDAEWMLMEAVDNHYIARAAGKISASNTALTLVARHKGVDAFAAEKIEMVSDKEIMERLNRGRKRMNNGESFIDEPSFL